MIKAFFFASSYQEASYWANQWGFRQNDFKFINIRSHTNLLGYYNPDIPAYVCGSEYPSDRSLFWRELVMRGFEVFDGQDLT